jgi:ribosome-binding protein aMBF1 (putative translation factor)
MKENCCYYCGKKHDSVSTKIMNNGKIMTCCNHCGERYERKLSELKADGKPIPHRINFVRGE